MKLEELRQLLETKQSEVRTLLDTNKINEAESKMQEVKDLKTKIKLTEELELDEKRDLEKQKVENRKGDVKMGQVNEMRTITKILMNKEVTPEERASVKTTDNSAVIPTEFINKLIEIKKGFGSLKEYTDVIHVTKNDGKIPTIDLEQNELNLVAEGDIISEGKLVTKPIAYNCKKYGLIQSLTAEVVEDAEVEITGLVNKNFAELVTRIENAKIIKVLKDNATEVTGATTYEDVVKAMDKALPSYRAGIRTVTNVDGFAYLKNLKDSKGKNLDLVTEVNGKFYFNGKELIVTDLEASAEGKHIFYVANIKEAVKFCDRKAVTIARSTEAGFNDDTEKVRILERFDVICGLDRSIKKIEF